MSKQQTEEKKAPVNPVVEDHVEESFRRILSLASDAPVPEDLLALYATYKRRVDICSAGKVTAKELVLLTILAGTDEGERGLGVAAGSKGHPAVEAVNEAFAVGARVVSKFKGKEVAGELVDVEGDVALVNVDNDSFKFRRLKLADTRPE